MPNLKLLISPYLLLRFCLILSPMLSSMFSPMLSAETFDHAYANWKVQQEAEDRRLHNTMSTSTSAQPEIPISPHTLPPSNGSVASVGTSTDQSMKIAPTAMLQVHLNTDSAEQLQQLKGIGAKKAQAIVDYRQQHGPFQQIEDLKKVKGIGEQTFEKNKVQLAL